MFEDTATDLQAECDDVNGEGPINFPLFVLHCDKKKWLRQTVTQIVVLVKAGLSSDLPVW